MGDIAEMIIEGILCQSCGCVIDGEQSSYPRNCKECDDK